MATTKQTSTKKKSTAKAKSASAKTAKKTTTKKVTTKNTDKTTTASAKTVVTKKSSSKDAKPKTIFEKLNTWNWVMALLHTAQAAAVLYFSRGSESLFPVSTNYLTVDTIADEAAAPSLVPAMRFLFDVNLAYVVAAFFIMSALAHLYIATVYRKKYESDLKVGINKARWYEYGISASTMMIAIAMLSGVSDASTLVLIFGGTLVMNLCGLIMEVHNQTTKKTNWISYWVGTIAGLLPWFAVGAYLIGANQYGEGDIPTFVYYIYGSIFVFFMSFAVNMWLQYKGKGKWSDYLYGERSYMILSLVAKSALAWQVFAGTLRP